MTHTATPSPFLAWARTHLRILAIYTPTWVLGTLLQDPAPQTLLADLIRLGLERAISRGTDGRITKDELEAWCKTMIVNAALEKLRRRGKVALSSPLHLFPLYPEQDHITIRRLPG